jgi:ATP-dependent Clp protease ATP-binding subunit ClpA
VWNLPLQIPEDGKLTDNTKYVVNFRNTILMTSNVGRTRSKSSPRSASRPSDESTYEKMRERILTSQATFRPEF